MENETMKQSFMSVQNRSLRNRLVANGFKQVLARGALLAAAAAATQPAVAAPEKVVVYQAFQSIMYLPLYVAMDKGFFAQNGLDVQKVTAGSGAQGVAAVIGGHADFSLQDPMTAALANLKGATLVNVANVVAGVPVWVIAPPDSALKSQADLGVKRSRRRCRLRPAPICCSA